MKQSYNNYHDIQKLMTEAFAVCACVIHFSES